MALPPVNHFKPYLGCDPEFFFKVDGKVVGSELVIPKDGLRPLDTERGAIAGRSVGDSTAGQTVTKFIIDGVQAELNPRPNTCRANLANEIAACFRMLKKRLDAEGKGVKCDFSPAIVIDPAELKKLDEANQKFGCTPSLNAHGDTSVNFEKIDPLTNMNRSAGGHIHIGAQAHPQILKKVKEAPHELVNMLDIIVGNTCVLIDRDPSNIERRKMYGRAGEYRLPAHGLEYRTLSNFWLRHYNLMSMVFGLVRLAVELSCDQTNGKVFYETFMQAVDIKEVQQAINENDFDLAYKNFKAIEHLIIEVVGSRGAQYAFDKNTAREFNYFVNTCQDKGLDHWFKDDPLEHWTTLPECHADGSYNFLERKVRNELNSAT